MFCALVYFLKDLCALVLIYHGTVVQPIAAESKCWLCLAVHCSRTVLAAPTGCTLQPNARNLQPIGCIVWPRGHTQMLLATSRLHLLSASVRKG
mmetsp:Transcript_44223/g.71948  ORF Transcript_44223/g.71948 Transcript_44223/m.71948 type:complete len:94 (+) Transcript_44223:707-988(+)